MNIKGHVADLRRSAHVPDFLAIIVASNNLTSVLSFDIREQGKLSDHRYQRIRNFHQYDKSLFIGGG